MAAQDYINQAVAAGIPLAAIRNFLSGNPGDEHRIMSALGPDYPATSSVSVTPAGGGYDGSGINPGGMYSPVAISEPYSTSGQPSGIFASSAADAALSGHGGLADNISRPQITIMDDRTGQPAGTMTVLPAAGIPPWVYLAAGAVLLLLIFRQN